MHELDRVIRISLSVLADLLPWFALAILIGACVGLFRLDILARRAFAKHGLLGILLTTSLGALSPFCSFTVIPLIRRLLRSGVPLSAVMSFWIASPAMSPGLFGATASELGLSLATTRLVGAVVLAVGAGLFVLLLERRGLLQDVVRPEKPEPAQHREDLTASAPALVAGSAAIGVREGGTGTAVLPAVGTLSDGTAVAPLQPAAGGCASACSAASADDQAPWWPTVRTGLRAARTWRSTGRSAMKDGLSLGKWLLFACIFQGLIAVYVPTHVVVSVLGGKGLLAIPMAVIISVPLYLNGASAIPIVGGLVLKGMAAGAAITFLLGGSVTTIPAMAAVRGVVRTRAFVVYLGTGIIGSILIGFVAQAILH